MTAQPKPKMTVDEFAAWSMGQPDGRYELVNGEIYAQASERAAHNRAKGAVYRVLGAAIKKAGLRCEVFTDGMSVKIDAFTAREPDASVQCGATVDPDAIFLDQPIIVVEVVSPTSQKDDTGSKLAQYFSLPSIQHYLIVVPLQSAIIHHARGTNGDIVTRVHTGGEITLSPPGMTFSVSDVFSEI